MTAFLWHAAFDTFAIIGAMSVTAVALVTAFLAREVRRTRKRPPRMPGRVQVTDEEIEAALREWAGDAL